MATGTTISAGTFTSYICQECFDGSGNIISTANKNTPHPVYTDAFNNDVYQLQMVVIGGPNGLNA
jgi:hypothetical protein